MTRPSAKLHGATGELQYQSGFGNEYSTEALSGALPVGQNSPQRVAFGLYAEQINGTSFTAPRALNRRSWFYRIRPSVMHKPYRPASRNLIRSSPFHETPTSPNQLRWDPLPIPESPTDFVGGLITLAGNAISVGNPRRVVHSAVQ